MTSCPSDCGEYSILGGSSAEMIGVLREPLGALPILAAVALAIRELLLQRFPNADRPVPPTWQREGKDLFR